MQFKSLETLVQILQLQSFSRAAEVQNMTLSALSMQMKTLETELDAALFDRAFRPPKLTPLGRRVAEQARQVLDQRDRLTDLCGSGDRLSGHFQIGIIQSASVRVMPRFLTDAGRAAPGAAFQFTSGLSEALSEKVRLGQLDAAIVTRVDPDTGGLNCDVIATEDMAIATPAAQADADADLAALAQNLPFIHFMPSSGIGKLITRALRDFPASPRRKLVLDSIEAAVECVKAGLGYTILPLPDLMRYNDALLHIRPPGHPAMSRDLALVTRSGDHTEKWRGALADLLRRACL